ncbi:MAG: type III-B CRISPR module RAMP protein Cmr6, partial [Spirulinaceae cyanobacterium SM2_1_0]|nr:type III-B CRISPR module RAMP protein Cmr6 [Spirulinaceae cyanobacterium SM2_1_0]
MAPNPTQRPDRPSPTQRPQSPSKNSPKRVISSGGGRSGGGRGGSGGSGGSSDEPSPWLDAERSPIPHPNASFVEYLRWMREPTRDYKDPTKVQILDWATTQADYSDRLQKLTDRTKKLAAVHFQVKCPWRIRVGGTKGPESILLPAFDALGMPYIPSSTLRGVARSQAVWKILQNNEEWQSLKNAPDNDRNREQAKKLWQNTQSHPDIAKYFGHLEAEDKKDRAAKIVFLDAYPLPGRHGLAMDIANNIWNWQGGADELPSYSPNPNPFLSLQEP